MKIEIYQIGKVPPLTVVECDDWYLDYEGVGDLSLLKDNKPIALFLLNNIAGFKVISEDGSKKEATTTDKTKSCLWCHDMRGNKNLGFTVSDKLAREIINNRFINFCPFCGRELRG